MEYIFQIDAGLYSDETGEVVFKPKLAGRLIRCKDCKHWVTVIENAEYGICNKRTNLETTSRMFFCGNGKEGKEDG